MVLDRMTRGLARRTFEDSYIQQDDYTIISFSAPRLRDSSGTTLKLLGAVLVRLPTTSRSPGVRRPF